MILNELPPQEQALAHQLTRSGYLVTEPSEADRGAFVVTFVSRLHMEYTQFCFYSQRYSMMAHMPTSMPEVLRLVLQRMTFRQLANSLNVSSSPSRGLLEAQYQNEFYRNYLSKSGCNRYTIPLDCMAPSLHCNAGHVRPYCLLKHTFPQM